MTVGALEQIQNETMTVLSKLFTAGQNVALVDFPNHENAGDSLIYLGELAYLKRLGLRTSYVADHSRYSPDHLRRLVPSGPILLHGGGNFGDRWTDFQDFRERVISDFPDREIIQLPQGIEFTEGPALQKAQRVLGAHPALTLLIRDHASVARTKELFPSAKVLFCPDMALGYGKVENVPAPEVRLLILQRRDSESANAGNPITARNSDSHTETDWGLTGLWKLQSRVLKVPGAILKRIPKLAVPFHSIQQRCYLAQAQVNVKHAISILGSGELVATNRLHATVLTVLMGRPVIALDNANGKISAIIRDYLGRLSGVYYASSVDEAHLLIAEHLDAKVSA